MLSRMEAFHIIGGEISYQCTGNNNYQITLKVYRDCNGGGAPFDMPAHLFIFPAVGGSYIELLDNPTITSLPVNTSNPCMIAPPNICVEEGIYTFNVNLPPSTGGYYAVYQRCCRNSTIINLVNPNTQGATYMAHIPDPAKAVCNSSPYFNNFPPIVICAYEPLTFDHSATDPDGDSLVYSLCAPFTGGSQLAPQPIPASPPPYAKVIYQAPYNETNPLPANPPLSIDPATGLLTGTPTQIGQYVVGVCVKEYRNGVLLGIHRREFQFNVANCNPLVVASIPTPGNKDTIYNCSNFNVSFTNQSVGASNFHWDFGVPGIQSDTSNLFEPSFTYPDTGTYLVRLIANPGYICSDTDTVVLKLYPSLTADFQAMSACPDEPVLFTDLSQTTYGQITKYEWFFGDGTVDTIPNPQHAYGQGGTYQVILRVTNSIGCVEQIARQVEVYPKPVADFKFGTPCLNAPLPFTDASVVSSGTITSWKWDFGDGSPPEFGSFPAHVYSQAGTYQVTLIVSTDHGCLDTVTRTVNIVNPVQATVSSDTTICFGDFARLSASGGLYYEWSPQAGVLKPFDPNPRVSPPVTTTYTVNVSDDCFNDTATVTVTVLPLPEVTARPDTAVYYGDSVWLWAVTNGVAYHWQPDPLVTNPFQLNTWALPSQPMTYTITVTGQNGCKASDEVTIKLIPICDQLYIPNAFSPNGDGLNDELRLVDFGQNQLISFQVFNRWGEKVFETNDPLISWDGTFEGRPQEMGVYVYIIVMRCGKDIIHHRGNLTLLR